MGPLGHVVYMFAGENSPAPFLIASQDRLRCFRFLPLAVNDVFSDRKCEIIGWVNTDGDFVIYETDIFESRIDLGPLEYDFM